MSVLKPMTESKSQMVPLTEHPATESSKRMFGRSISEPIHVSTPQTVIRATFTPPGGLLSYSAHYTPEATFTVDVRRRATPDHIESVKQKIANIRETPENIAAYICIQKDLSDVNRVMPEGVKMTPDRETFVWQREGISYKPEGIVRLYMRCRDRLLDQLDDESGEIKRLYNKFRSDDLALALQVNGWKHTNCNEKVDLVVNIILLMEHEALADREGAYMALEDQVHKSRMTDEEKVLWAEQCDSVTVLAERAPYHW